MSRILNNLAWQPIAFCVPDGQASNAKAVSSGVLDWTVDKIFVLDPTQSNQMLEMQNIQSVFIDNNSTGQMTVTVINTGHVLRIPAKSQGFLPLICSDRPILQFENDSANGTAQAFLLNIPALGVVWSFA